MARACDQPRGLTFSSKRIGGFAECEFDAYLVDGVAEAEMYTWLDSYIGRRLVVSDYLGNVAWEGLIWTVTLNKPGCSLSRSLENIYNYIRIIYYEIDTGAKTIGASTSSSTVSDADSIALYGQKELRIKFETDTPLTAAAADAWADRYLSNHKSPQLTKILEAYRRSKVRKPQSGWGAWQTKRAATRKRRKAGKALRGRVTGEAMIAAQSTPPSGIELGGSEETSMHVLALGYWATTRYKYYNNNPGSWAVQDTNELIQAILTAECPKISTNYSYMTDTGTDDTPRMKLQYAQDHIIRLLDLGDSWGKPVSGGIYADRMFHLSAMTDPVDYYLRLPSSEIENTTGQIIEPWLIRPGKILHVSDAYPAKILVGTVWESDEAADHGLLNPRNLLIAEVRYTDGQDMPDIVPEDFTYLERMLMGNYWEF